MKLWKDSVVTLTWIPEYGRWYDVQSHPGGWEEIKPLDQPGIDFARIGTCGRLWVRRRDLTRYSPHIQELF